MPITLCYLVCECVAALQLTENLPKPSFLVMRFHELSSVILLKSFKCISIMDANCCSSSNFMFLFSPYSRGLPAGSVMLGEQLARFVQQ